LYLFKYTSNRHGGLGGVGSLLLLAVHASLVRMLFQQPAGAVSNANLFREAARVATSNNGRLRSMNRRLFSWILIGALILLLAFVVFKRTPDIEVDKDLIGLSPDAVVLQLGRPSHDVVFTFNDSTLYEYRYGLRSYSRPNNGGPLTIVRELRWHKPRSTTVVWFDSVDSGWRSIDNLRWTGAVQF
jgi:hypothetical protein